MSATAPSQTVFSIGYDFHVGNGTVGSGTDNGNVWGITNYKDTTRNQTFTYDPLNRLLSAQNAGTDCTVNVLGGNKKFWGNNYGYDAWGNLLSKSKIGSSCAGESLSVTVGSNNRLGSGYLYDAAGNMTFNATAPTQTYTFDQENRLTGAAGYTYTYDGDGNRVRKSNGNLAANGTLYWDMTPGVVAETDLAGTLKSEYVFFDGERVARKDFPSNAVFYYFSDHLKTASVITDSAGVIKEESDYYPWGGELQFVNNDSNDYKFTGKKRDIETGFDYFGARYYSNGLGRFITPDWSQVIVPIPYADLTDPQSLNQYSYVRNIPTSRTDPNGHCTIDGENHGFWWCAGHAFGITETQKEFHARVDPERQWLIKNVAKNSGQANALQGASDSQVHGIYQAWDRAIRNAQCGLIMGCETYHDIREFQRAADGSLVLYRGGNFEGVTDFKLDAEGNVRAGEGARGPSLFDDPARIPPRFTEINLVKTLPPELMVKQIGKMGHFEVVAREPMSPGRFLELLKQIGLEAVKKPE